MGCHYSKEEGKDLIKQTCKSTTAIINNSGNIQNNDDAIDNIQNNDDVIDNENEIIALNYIRLYGLDEHDLFDI